MIKKLQWRGTGGWNERARYAHACANAIPQPVPLSVCITQWKPGKCESARVWQVEEVPGWGPMAALSQELRELIQPGYR